MKPIVIIGAGGFGRELFWLISEINKNQSTWDILGFLDDDPSALAEFPHYGKIIGAINDYQTLFDKFNRPYAVCSVGNHAAKKNIVERMDKMGVSWATIIHPSAAIGTGSRIGFGSILCHSSVITTDVIVGNHVHINISSCAGHDSVLGNFCTLSPHVDIAGGAVLGEGVFIGSHGVVLPKANVGNWAVIGGGSVAMRKVNDHEVIFGTPGKRISFSSNDK